MWLLCMYLVQDISHGFRASRFSRADRFLICMNIQLIWHVSRWKPSNLHTELDRIQIMYDMSSRQVTILKKMYYCR